MGLNAATVNLDIDPTKTEAPINPFIYGQFIEHLGRCIYGGIWAEMLEDRKFYFPITGTYDPYTRLQDTDFPVVGASPWEIIGPSDGVAMVSEDVFVGDHSPLVREGTAIRQNDLGVVADHDYTGSIWVRPLTAEVEVEITLATDDPAKARSSTRLVFSEPGFTKQAFAFTAAETTDSARLVIRAIKGDCVLGPPSLMPADNVRGMRRDTLALLKQLNGTIYRWPGGNFVSGYNWRDGVGDRDRRPPRKNPAWTGVEHNDFGTDEFLDFCREIRTEPMIAVNTGFGDASSAAQWVEYCNTRKETSGGAWRMGNGQEEPYDVKYWCVGNEMFGPWQLGFMQLHHYVIKHAEFAKAMWAADPDTVLVGVGDLGRFNPSHDPTQARSEIGWSQGMLEHCADQMNMLSEHFYQGRLPWTKTGEMDPVAHVALLRDSIRAKAEGHHKLQAELPNLNGRIVPIAMDEWNYWHREYVYGELGCVYDLVDGLGVAAGLHEFFRQSDLIQMAHYAQTVNVIGAIKTTRTEAEMETTGLVLQLYRNHYGTTPLTIDGDFGDLDVVAALTEDGREMTVGVVNPTSEAATLHVSSPGLTPSGPATRRLIADPDPEAHNTPGKPRRIDIVETRVPHPAAGLQVPPLSCALFTLSLSDPEG